MMSSRQAVPFFSGSNTARYKVVRGYFYPLVLTFEQDLQKVSAKLFEKQLISSADLDNASNSSQPVYDRSLALLSKVMKRIEFDQNNFEVFTALLREFSDIANELESSLKKEDSSTASHVKKVSRSNSVVYPLRRASDSRLYLRRRLSLAIPLESSGLSEDIHTSLHREGRVLLEPHQQFEAMSATFSGIGGIPTHMSALGQFGDDSTSSGPVSSSSLQTMEASRLPKNDKQPHPLQLANYSSWNKVAETSYMKSVYEQHTTEINDLKKTIEQLKAHKESCAMKLKKQGVLINQKDDEIEDLKIKCAEKEKVVIILNKDKADKEKRIHSLQVQCTEAKEEIQSVHKSYQDRIFQLQKDLEEIRSSEEKAKEDLAKAEVSLWKAKLSKEKELSKLREEYNKLKEIKNELLFQQRISQEEHRAESAVKDKAIAEEARQHAETKAMLATKEKEVAELRAQEERRKLELQVQELLEKLKTQHITSPK